MRLKSHETLVNSCSEWLAAHGFKPGCNSAVDLGLELPPVVFEAKVIGPSWASSIRAAVGQLYEYRYFQVTDPKSGLIFLADQAVPDHWITYLERDRGIGVAWRAGPDIELSDLARSSLGL